MSYFVKLQHVYLNILPSVKLAVHPPTLTITFSTVDLVLKLHNPSPRITCFAYLIAQPNMKITRMYDIPILLSSALFNTMRMTMQAAK